MCIRDRPSQVRILLPPLIVCSVQISLKRGFGSRFGSFHLNCRFLARIVEQLVEKMSLVFGLFSSVVIGVFGQVVTLTGQLVTTCGSLFVVICRCSSMAELQPSKLIVRVRFPSPAHLKLVMGLNFCCCSSVVERVLGKDEVMGSNPISSSDCVRLWVFV